MQEHDQHEWGPWVEHHGKGCPVKDGQYIRAQEADGDEFEGEIRRTPPRKGDVDVWVWRECQENGVWDWRVIRYRIRKPRGLTMLEEIANQRRPVEEVRA